VLSVDRKAGRLSLGLKPSYLEGESDVEEDKDGIDQKVESLFHRIIFGNLMS